MARRVSLKQRVSTRLAWLGISHKDFAEAIQMDKGGFSRIIRGRLPRKKTLERIAVGLGMTPEELIDPDNRSVLVSDHPALSPEILLDEEADKKRAEQIQEWYASQDIQSPTSRHRGKKAVAERRRAVRVLLEAGDLDTESIRQLARDYGVSKSQIYNDRALLENQR